jgi:hypothetical protein
MAVCPQAVAPKLVIPCCPPPAMIQPAEAICCPVSPQPAEAICCPVSPQPACPPSLTISASPDPLIAGHRVVVSGTLLRASGAGTPVTLWQRLRGQGQATQTAQATTDVTGSWSATLPSGSVMTDRSWYATADGVTSSTISEAVSAIVILVASHGRHGATLQGTVTPSHAGQRILVQRRVGRRWVTVARPRLGRHSRFRLHVRVHGKLQAVLPADSLNMRSVSPQIRL